MANAGQQQIETATIIGTVTTTIKVSFTTSFSPDGPIDFMIPVTTGESPTAVATAIRAAMAENTIVTDNYYLTGTGPHVVLTAKLRSNNDASLEMYCSNLTSTGLYPTRSANTSAGKADIPARYGLMMSPHYKVEMDLSTEPVGHNEIMPDAAAHSLINTFEKFRPVARFTIYSQVIKLETNFSGNAIDTYGSDHNYSAYALTKCYMTSYGEGLSNQGTYIYYSSKVSNKWTINHNLDLQGNEIVVQCYEKLSVGSTYTTKRIYPKKIKKTSSGQLEILFDHPTIGYAFISAFGAINSGISTTSYTSPLSDPNGIDQIFYKAEQGHLEISSTPGTTQIETVFINGGCGGNSWQSQPNFTNPISPVYTQGGAPNPLLKVTVTSALINPNPTIFYVPILVGDVSPNLATKIYNALGATAGSSVYSTPAIRQVAKATVVGTMSRRSPQVEGGYVTLYITSTHFAGLEPDIHFTNMTNKAGIWWQCLSGDSASTVARKCIEFLYGEPSLYSYLQEHIDAIKNNFWVFQEGANIYLIDKTPGYQDNSLYITIQNQPEMSSSRDSQGLTPTPSTLLVTALPAVSKTIVTSVASQYNISMDAYHVILTAKIPNNNDPTLNIEVDNYTTTGPNATRVDPVINSINTRAGDPHSPDVYVDEVYAEEVIPASYYLPDGGHRTMTMSRAVSFDDITVVGETAFPWLNQSSVAPYFERIGETLRVSHTLQSTSVLADVYRNYNNGSTFYKIIPKSVEIIDSDTIHVHVKKGIVPIAENYDSLKNLVNKMYIAYLHRPADFGSSSKQIESLTVEGTVTNTYNFSESTLQAGIIVESTLLDPKIDLDFGVTLGDSASFVAGKARNALNSNINITTHYIVGGSNTTVTLAAKNPAENDDTFKISLSNRRCTGIVDVTSTNIVAGSIPTGLIYWMDQLRANNYNVDSIIDDFLASVSVELAENEWFIRSTIDRIIDFIRYIFLREPAVGEVATWSDIVTAGTYTANNVLYHLLDSATGADLTVIEKKIDACNMFIEAVDPTLEGTHPDATYAGLNDFYHGRQDFLMQRGHPLIPPWSRLEIFQYVQTIIANPGDPILDANFVTETDSCMYRIIIKKIGTGMFRSKAEIIEMVSDISIGHGESTKTFIPTTELQKPYVLNEDFTWDNRQATSVVFDTAGQKQVESLAIETYASLNMFQRNQIRCAVNVRSDHFTEQTVSIRNAFSAAELASEIRSMLAANTTITTYYTVGGIGTSVVLTAVEATIEDTTLKMRIIDFVNSIYENSSTAVLQGVAPTIIGSGGDRGLEQMNIIQMLYIALYKRPVSISELLSGMNWLAGTAYDILTNSFIEGICNSSSEYESASVWGSINTNTITSIVTQFYSDVFNRAAIDITSEELNSWVNGFNNGTYTYYNIFYHMAEDAKGQDFVVLNRKIQTANLFTRIIDPTLTGSNIQVTYQTTDNYDKARIILKRADDGEVSYDGLLVDIKAAIADLTDPINKIVEYVINANDVLSPTSIYPTYNIKIVIGALKDLNITEVGLFSDDSEVIFYTSCSKIHIVKGTKMTFYYNIGDII